MAYELNRRGALGLGALTLGGLLAACGFEGGSRSAQSKQSGGSGGSPKPGGKITYLNLMVNSGFQQQTQIGSWHANQYWNQIVEPLVYVGASGKLLGQLATSWKPNADFTKWVFQIRKGVTFSNGSRLDAAAVAANYQLFGLGAPDKAIPRIAAIPRSFQKAEAISEYEVEMSLGQPYSQFVRSLAGISTLGLVAPETIALPLEEQSDLNNTWATGPFVVESWVAGKEIVLKRREDYNWPRPDAKHDGPAFLEKIIVQQIPEDAVRVGALQAGQADIVHYPQPSSEVRLEKAGYTITRPFAPGTVWGLHIRQKAPFLDDIRVREALNRATDREEIVRTLYNENWKVAQSPVNRATPWGVDLSEKFAFDLDRANALLDEAGWTDRDSDGYRVKGGKTLELVEYPSVFINSSYRDDLTLIAQQWKKAGIKLRIENVDYSNYPSKTSAFGHPPASLYEAHWGATTAVRLYGWWAPKPEDESHDPIGGQQDQFNSELGGELDQLLKATYEADSDEASDVAGTKALEYVIDNQLFIPVHEFSQNFASAPALKGIYIDNYPRISFYDAWLDS
ncbi:MAG: ABC transporter substrate-binding protein [Novosphingobium sp.]